MSMVLGDTCDGDGSCGCQSVKTDGGDPDDDGSLFSLSRRDTIKGVIGGGVVAANAYLFNNIRQTRVAAQPSVRDRFSGQIQLDVNGETRHVNVEDQERLLETLRYRMGLTGGKFGCDRAMCGACTVEIDGQAVYGCTYFTRDAVGKEITTIEGLANNGNLHPIQDAFIDNLGGQCAYCTPGFIMTAKPFLEENGDPSRDEVRQAISGVLCRCGNYEQEIDSVLDAAQRM